MSFSPPIFIVFLRRPKKNDRRRDPFYEFGSFGLTGCHRTNLLHPRNAERLEGARLAFIQGGDSGARLICLTPQVTVKKDLHEVHWNNSDMSARFLRYQDAPIVTEIDEMAALIKDVKRSTEQGRLASKFRSRTKPLPLSAAMALVRIHRKSLKAVKRFADRYEDTLPFKPDITETKMQRKEARNSLLRKAKGHLTPPIDQSCLGIAAGTQQSNKCR